MGFFGGGSTKMPAVQEPAPLPAAPVPVSESGDAEIKKSRRRSGFEKAILTGVSMEGTSSKKTTLG